MLKLRVASVDTPLLSITRGVRDMSGVSVIRTKRLSCHSCPEMLWVTNSTTIKTHDGASGHEGHSTNHFTRLADASFISRKPDMNNPIFFTTRNTISNLIYASSCVSCVCERLAGVQMCIYQEWRLTTEKCNTWGIYTQGINFATKAIDVLWLETCWILIRTSGIG